MKNHKKHLTPYLGTGFILYIVILYKGASARCIVMKGEELMATDAGDLKKNYPLKQRLMSFLSLFTSTGTLLCCALPAAIAAVAGGAAVGTLITAFPWLIPLSEHKGWIFLVAGLNIVFSGILTFRSRRKVACATTGGEGCEVAGRFTRAVFWFSVVIYGTGAFFAYGIVPVLRWLEG